MYTMLADQMDTDWYITYAVPIGVVSGALVGGVSSYFGALVAGKANVKAQIEAAKHARTLTFDTKMWEATRDCYASLFRILDAQSTTVHLRTSKACTDLYEELATVSGSIDLFASDAVSLSYTDLRLALLNLAQGHMKNRPEEEIKALRREFDGHSTLSKTRARKHIASWDKV